MLFTLCLEGRTYCGHFLVPRVWVIVPKRLLNLHGREQPSAKVISPSQSVAEATSRRDLTSYAQLPDVHPARVLADDKLPHGVILSPVAVPLERTR